MVTNLSRPVADVLVIGGGPAGLSTTLGLARQLYTVVVFDRPSQHPAPHMHNVLTWDHQPSQKLRNAGRAEILDRYKTVTFHDVPVAAVKNLHNGTFEMMDEEENVFVGKRVVLAQGVKTTTPDISGYDDLWGRSIFHCLFCDGYEERGGASAGLIAEGMLANSTFAVHLAMMAARLAKEVTIYSNGDDAVASQLEGILTSPPLQLERRPIERLESASEGSGMMVVFKDGSRKHEAFAVHAPKMEVNRIFAEQLGVTITEMGFIQVAPPYFETTVPGVFAVGDCASIFKTVPQALSMGSFAAQGISSQLCLVHDV